MRKQRKYLCARWQSTKDILVRYFSFLPFFPPCFSSRKSRSLLHLHLQSTFQVAPWQSFNSFLFFASLPPFALSDIPRQIVGIINSDCRFLTTVSFFLLIFFISFIRFSEVCCCCLLGKCYIYFLVEDSMKLKVFQIIFYDDYLSSISLTH